MSIGRQLRVKIGGNILRAMGEAGDLPLPNADRVAKVIHEYFEQGDWNDELLQHMIYHWQSNPDYWKHQLKPIRAQLRKRKLYFEHIEGEGWKFATKEEYQERLRKDRQIIDTRIETHNERADDGKTRWPTLNTPLLGVQQITERN